MIEATIEISFEQIEKIKEQLSLNIFNNAEFSTLFTIQLFSALENQIYNVQTIINEIKNLEGMTRKTITKQASQFKNEPLKGLWHKHHFQANFLVSNIGNHWGFNNKKQPKLTALIKTLIRENKSEYFTDELAARLSHELVWGSYKKRSSQNRITGEWIIFAKHKHKNYYLSLATHHENDENIYKRISSSCSTQYPFLF